MAIIGYAVLSLAMGMLAAELLRPKPPEQEPLKDQGQTNAHVRGTLLPILLGYNKVSPIIAWVGNRRTWEKKTGEIDGGLFHSDTDITQTQYIESSLHLLCVGPAFRLSEIVESGNTIFKEDITSTTHPSGSQLTCTDGSVFKIYWGEDGQAVDVDLAGLTGVATRYPNTCYIYWVRKELGQQSLWKNVQYYLEAATLGEESAYLDIAPDTYSFSASAEDDKLHTTDALAANLNEGDRISFGTDDLWVGSWEFSAGYYHITTSPVPSVIGTNTATVSKRGTEGHGVNPALAVSQLLFAEFPHGLGFDTSKFNTTDLSDLATYFGAGGTEISPSSVYLKRGDTIKAAIGRIMSDYGMLMYPEAETGVFQFKLLRPGDTATEIEEDYYNTAQTGQVISHSILSADRTVYTFLEAARSFQSSTILISDDGNARLSGDPNVKKQNINTATDLTTASVIASRKEQESKATDEIRLKLSSDLIDTQIGSLLTLEGLGGSNRVMSKKAQPGSSEMEMMLLLDVYSVDNNATIFESSGIAVPLPMVPDASGVVLDANRYLHSDAQGYYYLRARGSGHIPFASLYRSTDDIEFNSLQAVAYQTAGTLDDDLSASGGILASLLVEELGTDFADFWVSSLSDEEWRGGAVIAIVNGEYMFPQSMTVISAGVYQLNNILRGRLGTSIEAHSASDVISLAYRGTMPLIVDANVMAGNTLYLKARPYSTTEVLPLSAVDSVQLDYAGGGYRPLPCENLNTEDGTEAWVAGTDLDLRWDYKNGTSLSGAGFSITGEAASLSLPEGTFTLEFLTTGDVLKRTEALLVPNYTYANADLVSDFGSEPTSFKARVVNNLNGLTSIVEETTFTRV